MRISEFVVLDTLPDCPLTILHACSDYLGNLRAPLTSVECVCRSPRYSRLNPRTPH